MSQEIVCSPQFSRREFPAGDPPFCFVIMPFGDPLLQEIYEQHVKPMVEEAGLKCIRSDDIFSIDSVMEDIWASLCRCSLVVGEFTGRNPNVLYEAGIAHTLGKPLVLITQDVGDIPFDFKHIRVIDYKNSPKGYEDLRTRLGGTVTSVLAAQDQEWPRPWDEQQQQLESALHALREERVRTQDLYLSIESRHKRQLRYFHRRLAELGVREGDGPRPVSMCPVEEMAVSVDLWDDETKSVIDGPEVVVGAIEVGKYPITNAQYDEFVRLTGHYPPEHWENNWSPQMSNLPVVGVSWNDVTLYCEWLSGEAGRTVRLPTEAEWLAAAGYGTDRRRYPWGTRWRANASNSAEGKRASLTPVEQFEATGAAPNGCADLLGNVWEWTSSFYTGTGELPWRAVRGGATYTELVKVGCLVRLLAYPGHFLFVRDLGFRIVMELPPEGHAMAASGRGTSIGLGR
jgi:hypothetical protein